MNRMKSAKNISNVIYSVGVLIVLCLAVITLFGSNEAINPDSMIPLTWKEQSFIFLSIGTIPMFLACIAVYKFNGVKNSQHKKRNFIFIFLPGIICFACALFIIGVILSGFLNSIFHLW